MPKCQGIVQVFVLHQFQQFADKLFVSLSRCVEPELGCHALSVVRVKSQRELVQGSFGQRHSLSLVGVNQR